jgi:hypothetical protein
VRSVSTFSTLMPGHLGQQVVDAGQAEVADAGLVEDRHRLGRLAQAHVQARHRRGAGARPVTTTPSTWFSVVSAAIGAGRNLFGVSEGRHRQGRDGARRPAGQGAQGGGHGCGSLANKNKSQVQ